MIYLSKQVTKLHALLIFNWTTLAFGPSITSSNPGLNIIEPQNLDSCPSTKTQGLNPAHSRLGQAIEHQQLLPKGTHFCPYPRMQTGLQSSYFQTSPHRKIIRSETHFWFRQEPALEHGFELIVGSKIGSIQVSTQRLGCMVILKQQCILVI